MAAMLIGHVAQNKVNCYIHHLLNWLLFLGSLMHVKCEKADLFSPV